MRRALVVYAAVLAGERRFQFLQFVAVQILAGKAQRLQLRGVCRQAGGGFGAARNVQDAIVAEKRRQLPARGEAFPGGKTFPIEREQGAVVMLVACGQHVGEHLPAPGQHFRQVTPVDTQRAERIDEHRREFAQGGEAGNGIVVFGGDVSGVAERCTAKWRFGVVQGNGFAALAQVEGNGEADDAAADDVGVHGFFRGWKETLAQCSSRSRSPCCMRCRRSRFSWLMAMPSLAAAARAA